MDDRLLNDERTGTRSRHRRAAAILALVLACCATGPSASASVTVATSLDAWQALAGPNTTKLGFDDLGGARPFLFNDQYAMHGVTDPEWNDVVAGSSSPEVPDGHYLAGSHPPWGGAPPTITLDFAAPINAVAFRYLPKHFIDLYLAGNLIASGTELPAFAAGGIAGVYSDQAFDRIVLKRQFATVDVAVIDDLYFQTIPAPGVMVVFTLALFPTCGRRTR